MTNEITKDRRYEYSVRFGLRLQDALLSADLSQAEAARRMEVPPSRISEYVRGVILPPVSTIDRMIDVLDLDPRILFPEWEHQSRRKASEHAAELAFTSHEMSNDIGIPVGTAVPEK